MTSAHSGISHPFGASHGTASNDNTATWGASTDTEIEQNMREYVRWVPDDAPLHDRMYPNEFGKNNQASRVVDDYLRQKLNSGTASDPVGTHARMKHSDTYPYQSDAKVRPGLLHLGLAKNAVLPILRNATRFPIAPHFGRAVLARSACFASRCYQPETSAPRMYYYLGVRPLEGFLGSLVNTKFLGREQHMEHMQFVANNGDNFGMLKDGLFSDGAVGSDKTANMGNYQVLREKYNANLIDEARRQLEEEWVQIERKHQRARQGSSMLLPQAMHKRYHVYVNNCQDYIKQVLDRAATLATPQNSLKLN